MTTRSTYDGLPTPVRRTASGIAVPRPRITQAMLAEYEALKCQEARRQQLRGELMILLDQGAEIERGPRMVEIREQVQKSLSFAKLAALGGEHWAEEIRCRIEPTVYRHLIIHAEPVQANRRPQAVPR